MGSIATHQLDEHSVVIEVRGALDYATTPALLRHGRKAIADSARRMVIDLSATDTIEPAVAAAFVLLAREGAEAGTQVTVVEPASGPHGALGGGAAGRFVAVAPDVAAALTAEPTAEAQLSASWSLPVATSAARMARSLVRERCESWAVDPAACGSVTSVVSELVANAVVHGQPPITLGIEAGPEQVTVRVHDGATSHPRLTTYTAGSDTTGLGLHMVAELSDTWGVTTTAAGKWVWARVHRDS